MQKLNISTIDDFLLQDITEELKYYAVDKKIIIYTSKTFPNTKLEAQISTD